MFHSSSEFYEDSNFSPVKTPRKTFSPTQIMRKEYLRITSEHRIPLLKLQLEPAHQNPKDSSTASWSSFTSIEEKNFETNPITEERKDNEKIEASSNNEYMKNTYKKDIKEKKFQINISKPNSIFTKSHFKTSQTKDGFTKRTSQNTQKIKPIIEEESPLVKVINKKKENDKFNLLKETINLKKIFVEEKNVIDIHPFRNLIFAEKIPENLFKKHLLLTYKGVVYSKKLAQPSAKFLEKRSIHLKQLASKEKLSNFKSKYFLIKDQKKTLFMDLDETLIHSCHLKENPENILEINDQNTIKKIGFNIRPYCTKFLEKTNNFYEIYVFTASSELYAKHIIEKIDPRHRIQQIFNKNSTMNTKNGFIVKDLRIFRNRELKNMIIVDNLSHSFSFQIENGIPLLEWQSDRNDMELRYLYKYLKKAHLYNDVRDLNREVLKLNELGELKIEELGL